MKKIALALGLIGMAAFANAADSLNGTVWKTIDDQTNKPKAVVKLRNRTELTATIQNILTGEENGTKCEGPI